MLGLAGLALIVFVTVLAKCETCLSHCWVVRKGCWDRVGRSRISISWHFLCFGLRTSLAIIWFFLNNSGHFRKLTANTLISNFIPQNTFFAFFISIVLSTLTSNSHTPSPPVILILRTVLRLLNNLESRSDSMCSWASGRLFTLYSSLICQKDFRNTEALAVEDKSQLTIFAF